MEYSSFLSEEMFKFCIFSVTFYFKREHILDSEQTAARAEYYFVAD